MQKPISFDIEQGSVGDKIAGYTQLALQTTSAEGLTDLANLANDYAVQAADMALQSPEKIASLITDEITKLLDDTGALEQINNGVNAAQNIIELLKKGLDLTLIAAGVAGNISNLVACDPDITCVPSVKESMNAAYASARDILVAKYNEIKLQLISLYNQLICTSQDAVIDNIVTSINNILDLIEPLIDPLLVQYTGYTISEVRYICNTGFSLVNMLKRVAQTNKKESDAKKKAEQAKKQASETAQNVAKDVKDNADKIKEEAKKQAKEQFEKLSQDLDKDEIKAKLMDWLKDQSVILQNAFNIILIKDMIDSIKEQIQHIQNTSIENLADFCNILNICLDIFDLFGINETAVGITQEDIANIIIATGGMVVQLGKDVTAQVRDNAQQIARENIQNGKNTMQEMNNNAKAQAETAKNNATSAAENYAQTSINTTKNEINKKSVFTANTSIDGTTTTIDITVKDLSNKQDFIDYLSDFKQGNGKSVFTNGAKLSFANKIASAWKDGEDTEFTINGKEGDLTRKYIIKVSIQKPTTNSDKTNNSPIDTSAFTDQANQLANDASQSMFKMFSQAVNSIQNLDNVNADIDASAIHNIIDGKVLMFDQIVQMLKSLLPIVKAIQLLCHLAENYQINKEFEQSEAEVNMMEAAAQVADMYLGLRDIIDLTNTNFCTVRSQAMADFCMDKLNAQPDDAGIAVINQLKTIALLEWMSIHSIPNCFDMMLGTTLFFDEYGIKHGGFIDNTYDDLDTIEYMPIINQVRYDKQRRSPISSEILRAIKRKDEPFINTDINADNTVDNNTELESFINAISFESDEFEGQQSINLQELNLCAPTEVFDTLEGIPGLSVVEFGDEYTLGNQVQYVLNVKPGDSITDKTILAYIRKNGKDIPVRSKFSKGTVKSINNDSDYFHLYPTSCKRHIVLSDTSIGLGIDFDTNDVSVFGQRMKSNSYIYNLIVNNICYAVYPIMLSNATRKSEAPSNVSNAYQGIVKDASTIYEDDIKSFDSKGLADKIKGTSGNANKMTAIKDDQLRLRKQIIDHQIERYNAAIILKKNGNESYDDCKHLAYGSPSKFEMYQVSKDMSQNYYLSLLSRLDLSDKDDKYTKDYHKLLTDIIDIRIQAENYDQQDIIDEFDKMFNDCITTKYKESSAYQFISKQIVNEDYSYDNILELIKKYQYKQFDKDLATNEAITKQASQQLTNLFLYIKHTESLNSDKVKTTGTEGRSKYHTADYFVQLAETEQQTALKLLIKEEAAKLKAFWDNILLEYSTVYDLDVIIQDIKDYADNMNALAEWPIANKLRVGTYTCDLYTFTDPIVQKVEAPDLDVTDVDMENVNPPTEATYDINDIRDINEPQVGDITILDYEYWLTYMLNATMFTLLPIYWADGIDVPPAMVPTPLPAIYLPIAPPVFIKPLNLLVVFGIALRGIYPAPIILLVNLSTHAINALTPVMVALEALKGGLEQTIEMAESAIPRLVDGVLNGFSNESSEVSKRLEKFRMYAELIRSIPIEDKALIEREFMDAVYEEYDKRQVVTRLDKLGEGPEPM